MKKIASKTIITSSIFLLLSACSSNNTAVSGYNEYNTVGSYNKYQMAVLKGPAIYENNTDYTYGLGCVSDKISLNKKIKVTIDAIPDKSGKVNSSEGYKLTQGVESMAITALTKIHSIQVVERRNMGTFNIEADLLKAKRIGDNKKYRISDGRTISYKPLLSGKVHSADYFITGAITEVNYNLSSSGKILNVSGIELGGKTVRMSVAMDLRIVDVNTLNIIDSISLQKQFIGKRTKAGLYRFFDSELVNADAGSSVDEPLQTGVRALVERGVAQLVGSLFNINVSECYNDNIKIR